MYSLKGFMAIDELTSNTKGVIANHGEISTYSETFGKDIGKYNTIDNRNLQLYVFSAKDAGVDAAVNDELSSHIIALIGWIYAESKLGTVTASASELAQAVNTQFGAAIDNFKTGAMTQTGTLWLPDWVEWTMVSTQSYGIRVWLSDSAFRAQYDEYELVVIPPIPSVDQLIGEYTAVKALVAAQDIGNILEKVRLETATYPATMTVSQNTYWTDPNDETKTFSAPWTVVIRGNAGNNIDVIKTAIKAYITAHSSHDELVWSNYIPDIFKSTEYVLVPMWAQYAVPNLDVAEGVYSPMFRYVAVLDKVKSAIPGYNASHIQTYMALFDTMFNSLAVAGVGSIQNRDHVYTLVEKFSDYICVPSTHADFNRMSTTTQEWVLKIMDLLAVAEDLTLYSDVPVGYTRIVRDSLVYAAITYADVTYLVISKASYLTLS